MHSSTCFDLYNSEYKKSSWWWKCRLCSFCKHTKNFWYCRRPDNGIREVSNDCFKFYPSNCNHYVSINGYNSSLAAMNCGVSEGSALEPLLFLLYTNGLNHAIKFCKVHLFALMTLIYYMSNSIKKTEHTMQCWLKHLVLHRLTS